MALQSRLEVAHTDVERLIRENEQLRLRFKLAKFAEKSAENVNSTNACTKLNTPGSMSIKRSSSAGEKRVNSPTKSYLRPTSAWMNRTRSPEPEPQEKTPARPQASTCDFMRSYMQPTISSLNKVQWWCDEGYYEDTNESEDDSEPDERKHHWDSCPGSDTPNADIPSTDTSSVGVDNDQSSGQSPPPDLSVEEVPPTLAERTRLFDEGFENEPSTHVCIESVVAFRLLTEAFDLVRNAFYDFCKEHQPGIWRKQFPGGPHELLLEYSEIVRHFDYWHNHQIPGVNYLCVRSSLLLVKNLRNALCHFSPNWGVRGYDELLEYAQRAVVDLNDEPRAFTLRALRDELRAIAGETLEEIEELGMASITPCRREWKPHHEAFFRSLPDGRLAYSIYNPPYQHIPAVLLAFEAWKWQRESLGLDRPLLEGEDESKGLLD